MSVLLFMAAAMAADAKYTVDREESIFAVVTHKAGLGARFAHNHLMFPREYEAQGSLAGDRVEDGRFRIEFPVTALVADDPGAQEKWFPRLKALGVLGEAFKDMSDEDRAKVREAMLSEKQLDAARYPRMSAEVKGIRAEASKRGKAAFTHVVELAFTAHGRTVVRDVPARIEKDGDTVTVEAVGEYRFTEFGMKPYSALAGAVKNRDEFHLYVNVTGHREK